MTDHLERRPLAVALEGEAPHPVAWRLLLLDPEAARARDATGSLGASAGVVSERTRVKADMRPFVSTFITKHEEIVARPAEDERRDPLEEFDPHAGVEAYVRRIAAKKYAGWDTIDEPDKLPTTTNRSISSRRWNA